MSLEHGQVNEDNEPKGSTPIRGKKIWFYLGCIACVPIIFVVLLYFLGVFHPFALRYYMAFRPSPVSWNPLWSDSEVESLFTGTWELEIPDMALFDTEPKGWRETRLQILPDGTYILTNPPDRLEWLEGHQGTVEGKWYLVGKKVNQPSFGFSSVVPGDRDSPVLRAVQLHTLREGTESRSNLRLFPIPGSADDYVSPPNPVWKPCSD